jgi:hypothetical protein
MIKVNFKIVIIATIALFLTSCKSLDILLHPDNYISQNVPREKEYIYDTVVVSNDNGEMKESTLSGMKPSKQLIFSRIGQSYTFKPGETIEVVSAGADFSNSTFDIETNEDTKEITLKLVDKNNSKVLLESKCQTILRTGIDFVPQIEVAKGLSPEQIVVTPIFDDNCNSIGYQIRYGSTERGCTKEAKDILSRFQDCAKNKPIKNYRKISDDCRLKRKLGIPCD